MQGHVHFYTGLSYPELAACYSACEMFALPSRGEGFGLVYLEAMARGKPVIGGAHGGAPEVIDDARPATSLPPRRCTELATSIETLLADPAFERARWVRAAANASIANLEFGVFALKKILRELCES